MKVYRNTAFKVEQPLLWLTMLAVVSAPILAADLIAERFWTDKRGRSIRASVVSVDDEQVVFCLANGGRTVEFPLAELKKEDREKIEQVRDKKAKDERADSEKAVQNELQSLQGTWTVVYSEQNGERRRDVEEVKKMRLTIKDDKWTDLKFCLPGFTNSNASYAS